MRPFSLLALLGILVTLEGSACSETAAGPQPTAGPRDATVVVDLGTRPPSVRQRIRRVLPPLTEACQLIRIDSNCACADASFRASERILESGEIVPLGQQVSIDVTYVGMGKESEVYALVRATLASTADPLRLHHRDLRIRCSLDRSASLVPGLHQVRILVPLPSAATTEVELSRPIAPQDVKTPSSIPVSVVSGRTGPDGAIRSLVLLAAAVDRVGVRTGQLELPLSVEAVECVPLEVRYYAYERVDPDRILTRLPAGAVQETPIAVVGVALEQSGDWIRLECDEPKYESPATAACPHDRPIVDLRPRGQALVLRVAAGQSLGMFKGRCLVRPNPGATFDVVLEWTVRVCRNGGSGAGG